MLDNADAVIDALPTTRSLDMALSTRDAYQLKQIAAVAYFTSSPCGETTAPRHVIPTP